MTPAVPARVKFIPDILPQYSGVAFIHPMEFFVIISLFLGVEQCTFIFCYFHPHGCSYMVYPSLKLTFYQLIVPFCSDKPLLCMHYQFSCATVLADFAALRQITKYMSFLQDCHLKTGINR